MFRSPLRVFVSLFAPLIAVVAVLPAGAQAPRISALFPAGAKAGETVEVSVRGGGFAGAKRIMVMGGGGVTADLVGSGVVVDEKARPLFQNKCTSCHEARSPANRSMNAQQWASTVDRMINQRGAEINKPDRDKIVEYLQAQAKAGEITARVTVAKDATPGLRELRVLTDQGVSTAWSFEVSGLPEVAASDTNDTPEKAQKITLPVVVNGAITTSAEKDYFSFDAKKNQRLIFSLKGFRLNEQSQAFFNPVLYLYDSKGKEIGKNLGRFGLDPQLEWTAPEDGTYYLLLRDLLWRGSPSSVYRLSMGEGLTEGALSPSTARPGAQVSVRLTGGGDTANAASQPFTLRVPDTAQGVTMISTPMGDMPILVRDLPDGGEAGGATGSPVALPALFRGQIASRDEVDTFRVRLTEGSAGLELYARRLGSPLKAKVTIKNSKGNVVVSGSGEGENDLRLPRAFPSPGEYTVEVTSEDGESGAAYSYCWETMGGSGSDFALTALPDAINLGPGQTQVITVRATRRDNLKGPIWLTVQGLPTGVTASTAVLPPDDDKTLITLTAAPDAAPGGRPIVIEGRVEESGTAAVAGASPVSLVRRARPLEVYLVNNNARMMNRSSQVVAVGSEPPPFTLLLQNGGDSIALKPNEETKVNIVINRQGGFKGEITLSVLGLPPGINAQNFVRVPGDQNSATFTLRANGDARILDPAKRPMPGLPPVRVVIAGYLGGRDNDAVPSACTSAIALVLAK